MNVIGESNPGPLGIMQRPVAEARVGPGQNRHDLEQHQHQRCRRDQRQHEARLLVHAEEASEMEWGWATRLGLLACAKETGEGELKCSIMFVPSPCPPAREEETMWHHRHTRAVINPLQLPVAARWILSTCSASTFGMSSRLPDSAAITMSE